MDFHVLTLFPEMIEHGMHHSIMGRAIEQEQIKLHTVNIRDFSQDKHRKVDDYTYGGGAGMLMQPEPVYRAWRSVVDGQTQPAEVAPEPAPAASESASGAGQTSDAGQTGGGTCQTGRIRTIYVTPQGEPFTQRLAEELSKEDTLIFLCGHYEGIDERVLSECVTDHVSIGDYVLTGGELASMVMMDAIARLVPGVLQNDESAQTESFHGDLLEYPQYTRPEVWREKTVPAVLLSGDSKKIRLWRMEQSEERTKARRPDLYRRYERLQACRKELLRQKLLHIDMLQLIDRGDAELIYEGQGEILLQNRNTGLYLHTDNRTDSVAEGESGARAQTPAMRAFLSARGWNPKADADHLPGGEKSKAAFDIVFHQKESADLWCESLSLSVLCNCRHAVFTRREKLPVSGLYRADGKPMDRGENAGLVIRALGPEHIQTAITHYTLIKDPSYMKERIQKRQVYGAFLPDEDGREQLAAFVGFHAEGSCGMLEVFPAYRRRHLAMALETYIINLCLERGWTAYGQILVENATSVKLQNRMQLSLSEPTIYRVTGEL